MGRTTDYSSTPQSDTPAEPAADRGASRQTFGSFGALAASMGLDTPPEDLKEPLAILRAFASMRRGEKIELPAYVTTRREVELESFEQIGKLGVFIKKADAGSHWYQIAMDMVVEVMVSSRFGDQSNTLRCGQILLDNTPEANTVPEALLLNENPDAAGRIISGGSNEMIEGVDGRHLIVRQGKQADPRRAWGRYGGGERRRLK